MEDGCSGNDAAVAFGQGNDRRRRREGEEAATIDNGRKSRADSRGRRNRTKGEKGDGGVGEQRRRRRWTTTVAAAMGGGGRSQGRQLGGVGDRQRQRADGDTGAWRDHGGKEKGSHGVGSQNSRKIALVQPPRIAVARPTVKMRRGRRQTKAMGANGEAVKEGRGHGGGWRRRWVLVAEVEKERLAESDNSNPLGRRWPQ